MNAWEMLTNQKAIISHFGTISGAIQQRLEDLGFYPGETIICLKIPPFNGPKVYQNSHGIFSLEHEVAACIEVNAI